MDTSFFITRRALDKLCAIKTNDASRIFCEGEFMFPLVGAHQGGPAGFCRASLKTSAHSYTDADAYLHSACATFSRLSDAVPSRFHLIHHSTSCLLSSSCNFVSRRLFEQQPVSGLGVGLFLEFSHAQSPGRRPSGKPATSRPIDGALAFFLSLLETS